MPKKDKLDEIAERFQKAAVTGEETAQIKRDEEMARIVGEFKPGMFKTHAESYWLERRLKVSGFALTAD